jgi:hypothetical protein
MSGLGTVRGGSPTPEPHAAPRIALIADQSLTIVMIITIVIITKDGKRTKSKTPNK